MSVVEKISGVVERICQVILIVIGTVMPLLTFVNAILRKVDTIISLTWADEVCRYGFIYMTFIGMILCAIKGRHACVDLIFEKVHGRGKGAVQLVGNILVIIFLVIMFSGAIDMLSTAGFTPSPILKIPLSAIYFSLVIGSVLTIFVYLVEGVKAGRLLVTGKEAD